MTTRSDTRTTGGLSARSYVERTIVFLVLLCVAVLSAGLFVVALGLVDPSSLVSDPELRQRLTGFATDASWSSRALIAGGSLIVGFAATALVLGQFRRTSAADRGPHVVSMDDTGAVLISTQGVATIAETAATRASGVTSAEARIAGRGQSPVRIRIAANVLPGANLAAAGREIKQSAREAVERLAGLDVNDVTVRLDIARDEATFMELS